MIVDAAFNTVGNFISTAYNNRLAEEREEKARLANYRLNEKAAENADRRTRALYNDLYSVGAQMDQLKDAGLSPSIYASGGLAGMSGQTGAQGGGTEGIYPNTYGINPIDVSQIRLNNAQANKLEEETRTEAGTNQRGQTEIEKNLSQIQEILSQKGLNDAAAALANYQAGYQEWYNNFCAANETSMSNKLFFDAEIAANQSEKLLYEAMLAGVQFEIAEDTKEEAKAQVRQDLENSIAQEAVFWSQVGLNKAQAKLAVARIDEVYGNLYLRNAELLNEIARTNIQADELKVHQGHLKVAKEELQQKWNIFQDNLEFEAYKLGKELHVKKLDIWVSNITQLWSSSMINRGMMGSSIINAGGKIIGGK